MADLDPKIIELAAKGLTENREFQEKFATHLSKHMIANAENLLLSPDFQSRLADKVSREIHSYNLSQRVTFLEAVAAKLLPILENDPILRENVSKHLAGELKFAYTAIMHEEFKNAVSKVISHELGQRVAEVGKRLADRLLREEEGNPFLGPFKAPERMALCVLCNTTHALGGKCP